MATSFVVVDPDDPSATVTLQASSGSPGPMSKELIMIFIGYKNGG